MWVIFGLHKCRLSQTLPRQQAHSLPPTPPDLRSQTSASSPLASALLIPLIIRPQESLGGRAKTSIVATLSPADDSAEESLSTLSYADAAQLIKNKVVCNSTASKRTVSQENNVQGLRIAYGTFRLSKSTRLANIFFLPLSGLTATTSVFSRCSRRPTTRSRRCAPC